MSSKFRLYNLLLLLNFFFHLSVARYYDGAKIVTYGEPCISSRNLPIRIEGPRPPVVEPKIPAELRVRVVPEVYEQPARTEYPIAIEVPKAPPSPLELTEPVQDSLRGRSYGYNIDVPPVVQTTPTQRSYNFGLQFPVPPPMTYNGKPVEKPIRYLTGLTSRVDRVLVPACEAPST